MTAKYELESIHRKRLWPVLGQATIPVFVWMDSWTSQETSARIAGFLVKKSNPRPPQYEMGVLSTLRETAIGFRVQIPKVLSADHSGP
jgi:hypothetical protein